ncbi:hypothetical protein SCUCBS95973_009426 [Sporothrix curviconia]|uniref:Zn(2)-C6 fungal-type domain-containing protein n=1 Tax=Sporothrix curviconia TaxID=1260050 RepID=A0ABP0CXA1_9PEZI
MASRSYSNNSRDEPEGSESNQPSKVRRTLRACLQCRLRKQKCAGASRDSPSRPCPRCVHLGMSCSFESTPTEEQRTSPIAKTARRVEVLQRDFADHERRIRQIELLLDDYGKNVVEPPSNPSGACSNAPPSQQKRQDTSAPSRTAGSEANATTEGSGCDTLQAPPDLSNAVALDADADTDAGADAGVLAAVNLDTPMTTLRHLRHLRPSTADRGAKAAAIADPISCGILTLAEAQAAFDVLFQRCHRWGPVLCPRTQRSVEAVRTSNPTLFLSVCTVGCRFMPEISLPTYHRLVALLDSALSRLLLRPTPEDVHLDHICALLLYVQWMPCDDGGIHSASRDSSSEAGHSQKERMFVTRYNDVSTWSMLGLAIRYALLLGLHSDAVVPFLASPKGDQHPQYPQHALHTPSRPTQQRANGLHGAPVQPSSVINVSDVSRLRVWINLLTCDANLMLSSGLPASLNPEPVADIARTFAAHRVAAQPDDTRAAALCELVVILKRAAKSSGRPNVRALDAVSLRKANADLDAWEQSWLCTLGEDIQRSQMPFTTLRAYRLAINSSCLSSLLSSSPRPPAPATLHELHNGSKQGLPENPFHFPTAL